MKMMIKRFITAAFMMAVVILALAACGIKKEAPTITAEAPTVTTEAPPTTTEAPTVTETSVETEPIPPSPLPNLPEMKFEAIAPELVAGKVYTGTPISVHEVPVNNAVCRNLTETGMEMDAPLNIAFKWDEIKEIKPGDAIEVDGELLPVTSVFGEELTGTPDLIAINNGDFYIQTNLRGLGWGVQEGEALLLHNLYHPATAIVTVQVEFPEDTYASDEWDQIYDFQEFVKKFTGKEFMAVVSYGTERCAIISPTLMSQVEEMRYR